MSEAKTVKLVTGEEIICQLVDKETYYQIINPIAIGVVPSKSGIGQPGLGFIPFCFSSTDSEFNIGKEKVVYVVNTDEKMVDQYNSIFSGIVTPQKSIITH